MLEWKRWDENLGSEANREPNVKMLSAHKGLHKAESSIITQVLTGKIGLRKFLYERGVPGMPSPDCPCGQAKETPKHVTIHSPRRDAFKALQPSNPLRLVQDVRTRWNFTYAMLVRVLKPRSTIQLFIQNDSKDFSISEDE